MAHEISGTVGILLYLIDIGEGLIAWAVAQHQQVTMADDRRQQIVEVMRNAARQLANRQHFLGLGELRLQLLFLGDVEQAERDYAWIALQFGEDDGASFLRPRRQPCDERPLQRIIQRSKWSGSIDASQEHSQRIKHRHLSVLFKQRSHGIANQRN